jgi:membrane-associated phospholipid phosphatase
MAPTGLDHELRLVAQRKLGGSYDPEPVSVAAPYVLGGGALMGYAISRLAEDCTSQRLTAAAVQAFVLSAGVVGAIKWGSGRSYPTGGLDPTSPDRLNADFAQRFEPFSAGLGAFPSGHTATVFSLAAVWFQMLPDSGLLRYVGYPLGAAVGFGMWFGDHHFASDVLSGAFLGEAIGRSVGRSFAEPSDDAPTLGWMWIDGGAKLTLGGTW